MVSSYKGKWVGITKEGKFKGRIFRVTTWGGRGYKSPYTNSSGEKQYFQYNDVVLLKQQDLQGCGRSFEDMLKFIKGIKINE